MRGVLEQVTVGLMERLGPDARLKAEGLVEEGFQLADGERLIRIDVAGLTGQTVVVYGQTEIPRDPMEAAPQRGLEVIWEVAEVALHAIDVPLTENVRSKCAWDNPIAPSPLSGKFHLCLASATARPVA